LRIETWRVKRSEIRGHKRIEGEIRSDWSGEKVRSEAMD
jgi:hypothetical protein